MDFTFRFTNSSEDLVDCAEAWQSKQVGRPFARIGMALFGAVWLGGGVYGVFHGPSRDGPLAFLAVLAGGVLIWRYAASPIVRNRRIRRAVVDEQTVVLRFSDSGVDIQVSKGNQHRQWSEVRRIVAAQKGVVVQLGQALNWLPNRAFRNREEREEFLRFANAARRVRGSRS